MAPRDDAHTPITIDGSAGEGGGQIIRTALALSALTGRPLAVEKVRARRSRPGLQAQHLTAVNAAAALCDASVSGAAVGATHFVFSPRKPLQAGSHSFDIGTAGATTLVAQTIAVPLALAGGGKVTLSGGTHVPMAPTTDYLEAVFAPAMAALGMGLDVESPRAGFFPKGGGALTLVAHDTPAFAPIAWAQRGELADLRVIVVLAGLPESVAQRGLAAVNMGLGAQGLAATAVIHERQARNPGVALMIAGRFGDVPFGFAALGEKGKAIEAVAQEAVRAFIAWWSSAATVDPHLADQLVLPLALAAGESRFSTYPVTEHLRTVLAVVQRFLPIEVDLHEQAGRGEVRLVGAPQALRLRSR